MQNIHPDVIALLSINHAPCTLDDGPCWACCYIGHFDGTLPSFSLKSALRLRSPSIPPLMFLQTDEKARGHNRNGTMKRCWQMANVRGKRERGNEIEGSAFSSLFDGSLGAMELSLVLCLSLRIPFSVYDCFGVRHLRCTCEMRISFDLAGKKFNTLPLSVNTGLFDLCWLVTESNLFS